MRAQNFVKHTHGIFRVCNKAAYAASFLSESSVHAVNVFNEEAKLFCFFQQHEQLPRDVKENSRSEDFGKSLEASSELRQTSKI